jgi:uncharacterized membrane protein YphA (DoxX/SURF4 family)
MTWPLSPSTRQWLHRLARWLIGGFFLYSGIAKTVEPAEFLKLLREYDLGLNYLGLNLVAATLPWFEAFLGSLLILGIAVRGSALITVSLLVPFTLLVLRRALEIHGTEALAFCGIRFDCGCGTGEVLICRKLAENTLLILMGTALTIFPPPIGHGPSENGPDPTTSDIKA